MVAPKEIKSKYEEVVPGVYQLVPNDIYHSTDGLSKTNLCDIYESVSLYNMKKNKKEKPTDPMIKGSALHDLCLLPDVFKETYVVGPTINRTTKKWKEFIKEHPDKVILTPGMSEDVFRMRDSLYDNPRIREILESKTVLREVSIWVKDPFTGLIVKIRPDIVLDGVIYDIKTTIAPHSRAFLHSVYKYNYFVQSALYQDVAKTNGMQISNFIFLVVGSTPPHLTAIYDLNEDLVQEGRDKYREALMTYSKYLMSDDGWDGLSYGREVVTL
jgi:hypothetical protein